MDDLNKPHSQPRPAAASPGVPSPSAELSELSQVEPREEPSGLSCAADRVRSAAKDIGFHAVGIARADVSLDRDMDRYRAFLGKGMHGEMAYLAADPRVRERLDGDAILSGARSVICVAWSYGSRAKKAPGGSGEAASIAAYARGGDYHRFLRRRLRRLASFVRSLGTDERPVRARPLCDVEPVLERAWAARAGLGFIGKNGLLIVPGIGSTVLLGEVVTTLDLPGADLDVPQADRCGSCTRCLDACPTQAFVAPFVLDPRRCVSYLTIEQRTASPEALRDGIGDHLFGCDDCQTVCPYNSGSRLRRPFAAGDPFEPLERWSRLRLEAVLSLDEAMWRVLTHGSPLRRAGRGGMARNAAIVLGNRGDRSALHALRAAAAHHDDPVVREAASWACDRIARGGENRRPHVPGSRRGVIETWGGGEEEEQKG